MAQVGTAGSARESLSLQRFMELMRLDMTRDLVRKINRFTEEMEAIKNPDPNRDSHQAQTFFEKMETELLKHRIWPTLSSRDRVILTEGIETYVLTKLYKRTFARYNEDLQRDNLLTSRLYALQFVSTTHLDIPSDIITTDAVQSAMRELQKVNGYKAPKDKLTCILNCCQLIQHLLYSAGQETGADSFLPVLTYVVIKTQPINLISNIEYIRRFRMKSKLVSYEDYYFTQFSSAAFFIESADAESFTGGREEFLSSFLQQGLITWKQYEDAIQGEEQQQQQQENHSNYQTTTIHSIHENSETSLADGESRAASSISDLKSLKDDNSTLSRSIDWTNMRDVSQLLKDGYAVVTQLAASGDLATRYPLLGRHCGDLTVNQVETVLHEYKKSAMNHEILLEAARHHDTAFVLNALTEFENKLFVKTAIPSEGRLLLKYPFLCSSIQSLTFRDISRLLNCYKTLVLESEALISGIKRRIVPESSNGQSHSAFDFPVMTDDQEPYFRNPQETEAPLITRLAGPIKSTSVHEETETSPLITSRSSLFRRSVSLHQRENSQTSHGSSSDQHIDSSGGANSSQDYIIVPSYPLSFKPKDDDADDQLNKEDGKKEDSVNIELEVVNEGKEEEVVRVEFKIWMNDNEQK